MNNKSLEENKTRQHLYGVNGSGSPETSRVPARRNIKDTLFRGVFDRPEELLSLYNAVSGRNYTDPSALEINTLENVIYMGVKNDVSFVVDSRLNLYEHQSTVNPNMPTRFLIYAAHLIDGMIRYEELHSSRKKLLPVPEFVVFYNGIQEQPERQILRLSELYEVPSENPSLELKVTVLNINPGMNEELKKKCPKLAEYMEFVERLRSRVAAGESYGDAVHNAVEECIQDGILRDYLLKNREAVTSMLLENYDEQAVREVIRKDGIAEGRAQGMAEGMAQGIEKGMAQGIDKGKLEALAELMKNGNFSEDQACELLGIFGDERTRLLEKLNEKSGQL